MNALIFKLRRLQRRLVLFGRRFSSKVGSNCHWYQCKAKNLFGL